LLCKERRRADSGNRDASKRPPLPAIPFFNYLTEREDLVPAGIGEVVWVEPAGWQAAV
jgi:hypothetical protein